MLVVSYSKLLGALTVHRNTRLSSELDVDYVRKINFWSHHLSHLSSLIALDSVNCQEENHTK
jgi:hypothetical protein